jgi:exopolysaccharide production protein ExoZ
VAQDGQTLASIQALRVIAASGVVLTHARGSIIGHFGLPADIWMPLTFGGAGVDLFFVISGLVIVIASAPLYGAPSASLRFWLRRCIRIVPLYWAAAVYTLYSHGFPRLPDGTRDVVGAAATFLFWPYQHPLGIGIVPFVVGGWTINYEMFFYFLFGVCLFLPARACIGAIAIALVSFVVLGARIAPQSTAFVFWSDPIVLEFVLGTLIGWAYLEGVRLNKATSSIFMLIGVAAVAAMVMTGWGRLPRFMEFGGPAALIVASVALSKATLANNRLAMVIVLVGNASYALYLVHPSPSIRS